MRDLLPPNASPLERKLAKASAEIERVPVTLRELINPDKCPEALLPMLASAFSVDYWDPDWTADIKRAFIRNAFDLHKKKGTITALRRVIAPFGTLEKLTEWWQTQPPAPRGTFKVAISVLDSGFSGDMFPELERLIDDAKPLSRHLTGIAIVSETRGYSRTGIAVYSGDEMTIYPYTSPVIASAGRFSTGAAMHSIDTMTIQPGTA
ncbi:phage tail protein I [Undibacterium squillarum]|uniref:phage tail protein I n=1 Tax=Undibacterium squillarum TaxID=1131567 RepID=UPI0035B02D67